MSTDSKNSFQSHPPDDSRTGKTDLPNEEAMIDSRDATILSKNPPLEIFSETTEDAVISEDTAIFLSGGMLPAGTVFGHYVITKYIGGGGMGRVYLGIDEALDRRVAIKVLPHQRAMDRSAVARFMNEARSAARLNHEHIAQVYFAGEHNRIPFIAFEFVEGINIRAMVDEKGPLPLSQTVNYLLQISQALAHAATHHVIHRDVKPSNILITQNGRAKLIDMGLARLLSPSAAEADLTASGVTLGTFDYISPEQARDPRNTDTRSDIYSLVCTFYFMLTGRPPFSEGTVLQKLLQHQGDLPPDVRDLQPNIPEKVARMIQKMMAKEPKHRFQTADELVEALLEIAEMIGLRPMDSDMTVWGGGHHSRKTSLQAQTLPWLIPALILFGLVTFFHYYWMNQSDILPPDPFNEPGTLSNTPPPINTLPPSPSPGPKVTEDPIIPTSPDLFVSAETKKSSSPESVLSTPLFLPLQGGIAPTMTTTSVSQQVYPFADSTTNWSEFYQALIPNPHTQDTNPSAPGSERLATDRRIRFDPTGKTEGSVTSLTTALKPSDKETVIELCFSGSSEMDALTLSGINCRFVAAQGHQPTLVFRPAEAKNNSMFTLSDSSVKFEKVKLEFQVPRSLASQWSMFNIVGPSLLEFHNSELKIRNTTPNETIYHENVAFFRYSPRPIALASQESNSTPVAQNQTIQQHQIRMTTSIVHGEATVLKCDTERNIKLEFDNTFVASAQPFFTLRDVKDVANAIEVKMNHVTAYIQALVTWQNGFIADKMAQPISMTLDNSLIQLLKEGNLAEYQGNVSSEEVTKFFNLKPKQTFFPNAVNLFVSRSTTPGQGREQSLPNLSYLSDKNVTWANLPSPTTPINAIVPTDLVPNKNDLGNPMYQITEQGDPAGIIPSQFP